VSVRPVAVTALIELLDASHPAMTTMMSPVCHDTEAVVFVPAPAVQTVSV
jgi:hypothetical protein